MRYARGLLIAFGLAVAFPALAFTWYGPGSGAYYTGWVSGDNGFGFSWPWGFLSSPVSQPLPALNQAPVFIPVSPQVGAVGNPISFAVSAYDPEGLPVTYSSLNLPSGAAFDAGAHVFSWTPAANQTGNYAATFRAFDRVRFSDLAVSITVNGAGMTTTNPYWYGNQNNNYNNNQNPYQMAYVTPVNRKSQFSLMPPITVRAGQPVSFQVQAYDYEGDYLRYSAANLPQGARFDDPSHTFYWVPTPLQIGRFSIPFRVSDSRAEFVEMSVSVTVTDQNGYLPPMTCTAGPGPYYFQFTPPTAAREGDLYWYQVIAASGNINPLTFRVVDGPPGLTIGQDTGYIRWVPAFNQGGVTYPVRIAAYNNQCEAMKNFTITVQNVN